MLCVLNCFAHSQGKLPGRILPVLHMSGQALVTMFYLVGSKAHGHTCPRLDRICTEASTRHVAACAETLPPCKPATMVKAVHYPFSA